jgi:hypothetical protein
MVDVLLASENLSVFGGPSRIDVSVDYGAQGQRGTFIFKGNGKPTDPDVDFPQVIQPYDLYINTKPSDFEYLFLYQYGNVNGILQWSKVLRLIPNTALANIPVIFYNGEAVTFIVDPAASAFIPGGVEDIDLATIIPSPTEPSPAVNGMLWLNVSTGVSGPWQLKLYNGQLAQWILLGTVIPGLSFPVADYFPLDELGTITSENFNIQYNIFNETPVASGLSLGELALIQGKIYLPISLKASQTESDLLTWEKITGIRTLNFVITAGIGTLVL